MITEMHPGDEPSLTIRLYGTDLEMFKRLLEATYRANDIDICPEGISVRERLLQQVLYLLDRRDHL